MTSRASSKSEEQALLAGCVNGEPGRWEQFVEQYGRLVGKTAATLHWKCGGRGPEIEDLVAHVYEKLLEDDCRRLRAWRGQARFSTYLVQVARNLCIDQLKKTRLEVSLDSLGEVGEPAFEQEGPELAEWQEARAKALREAIQRLTPKRAMIMQLRLKGIPLREIAAIMQVPEGTVFVESSRAMTRLRKMLESFSEPGRGGEAAKRT